MISTTAIKCRQCGDLENESRPLADARRLGRMFGSAEQMTRQPQSRRRDEREGDERRVKSEDL
jgi:hypothetical protein